MVWGRGPQLGGWPRRARTYQFPLTVLGEVNLRKRPALLRDTALFAVSRLALGASPAFAYLGEHGPGAYAGGWAGPTSASSEFRTMV